MRQNHVAADRRLSEDEQEMPAIREGQAGMKDDLDPARGIFNGIIGGLILWALLIAIAMACDYPDTVTPLIEVIGL